MTVVVTFQEYVPLPRYDGLPWTKVRIYEAADSLGPWTQIQLQNLSPVDADPTNPQARNLTTTLATLEQGWYQLVFEDAAGLHQQATFPVHNVTPEELAFEPNVVDVAKLLRARTENSAGVQQGTFTATTRPQFQDVAAIIDFATRFVVSAVDSDIPEESFPSASAVIALYSAMIIELSYFPEQVNTPRSPYEQYKALFDQELQVLLTSVARERAEEETGDETLSSLEPSFHFKPNAGGLVGWNTVW